MRSSAWALRRVPPAVVWRAREALVERADVGENPRDALDGRLRGDT